jgi:uncharacterized protein YdeI (YjbR/CyaY-like superfamily)
LRAARQGWVRVAGEHLEQVEIGSRAALRSWLAAHHRQAESIWLVVWKKGSPRHVPYDDIVEEALCFGWVDSLPRKLDAERSMLLLSPRKPKSAWSKPNKERVERLIASGLMAPAGLAVVDRAKAAGTWDKLDGVEALEVPPDLAEAFARYSGAAGHFAAFPRSAKRGILEWIVQAKKPETRAKRVDETARLAAENIRANQFRR